MTKLEWERAQAQERDRQHRQEDEERARVVRREANRDKRQAAMQAFVGEHELACFNCGQSEVSSWAKTGINGRGPWAICAPCIAAGDS